VGPGWQRERKGERGRSAGSGWGTGPGAAHAGVRREERGPREEMGQGKREPVSEKREGELGRAKEEVWAAFFYFFSFPFLSLYSNHSNKAI
jgi:hypothetical protein